MIKHPRLSQLQSYQYLTIIVSKPRLHGQVSLLDIFISPQAYKFIVFIKGTSYVSGKYWQTWRRYKSDSKQKALYIQNMRHGVLKCTIRLCTAIHAPLIYDIYNEIIFWPFYSFFGRDVALTRAKLWIMWRGLVTFGHFVCYATLCHKYFCVVMEYITEIYQFYVHVHWNFTKIWFTNSCVIYNMVLYILSSIISNVY